MLIWISHSFFQQPDDKEKGAGGEEAIGVYDFENEGDFDDGDDDEMVDDKSKIKKLKPSQQVSKKKTQFPLQLGVAKSRDLRVPGFRVGIGFSGRDPGIPGIQFFNEFTRPCSRFEQNSDKHGQGLQRC